MVRYHAIESKFKLINGLNSNGLVLDYGCGTGEFLGYVKKQERAVLGVEPSEFARKQAIQNHQLNVLSLEEFPSISDNSASIISLWHVLEHVPNLEEYISELKRLIKSSGTIIIAVPNFKSYDAKYYGEFWAAFDVPRHLWHFSKTAIQKLFAKQNLKLVEVLPMKFDSFYVSLLSEKYKNGKMNFLNAFWIGLKSNQYGNRKKEYSSHIYVIKSE
jgi:2-polyprenyl-3-methyl-5-hydroxy-6-metoxy-1,4-benzoquinol methylase